MKDTKTNNWEEMIVSVKNLFFENGLPDGSSALFGIVCYLAFITALISIMPKKELQGMQILSLMATFFVFLMFSYLLYQFDPSNSDFQYRNRWLLVSAYEIYFSVGVDGLSLWMLLLSTWITPLCLFASFHTVKTNLKQFILLILLIELFLILSFISTNLIWFYIFFESVLIPMFIMIGFWGSRDRKIHAAYYFFLYTLLGSFFMLYGIFYFYHTYGSLEYDLLLSLHLSQEEQSRLWFFFFIPFAIKIPMVPFHLWLPEAHVEAPTIGSVILASLLLKLGSYGLLRFTITMFDLTDQLEWSNVVILFALLGVVYGSLAAMRQTDLKRIIAYSSIAHMNLIVLGLFSQTHQGLDGAIYLMLGHGIVAAGLFFGIGVLSDRYNTRLLKYFSGLTQVMPLFSGFFFLFTLGSMAFPGTSNFVGELLIFIGLFQYHSFIMVVATAGIVLSALYSIWLYNRVFFGTLKTGIENGKNYVDLNRPEIYIFVVLAAAMFALGLSSTFITAITFASIKKLALRRVYKR